MRIKNEGKRINKWELVIRITIKIFEKNPNRGGTPANDKSAKESTFVKSWVWGNVLREYKVISCMFTSWRKVVKNKKDVRLYITRYVNIKTKTCEIS